MAKKQSNRTISGEFTYGFPAIRALQAGSTYYTTAMPFEVLVKLLKTNPGSDENPIDRDRAKAIADYICQNIGSFVLPPITLSVSSECHFVPYSDAELDIALGVLTLPINASFQIHDGSYRIDAIAEALAKYSDLSDETLGVVIYTRTSDRRFGVIKANQRKSGRAERIVSDPGDVVAKITRRVIAGVPAFANSIEMVKTTISNRSHNLFTFSALYQANEIFLANNRELRLEDQVELATAFWKAVQDAIPDWTADIPRVDLRKQKVHAHGVTLCALARVGAKIVERFPNSWKRKLGSLKNIDWSRDNAKMWEGKAMFNGRMTKSAAAIEQTAETINKHL